MDDMKNQSTVESPCVGVCQYNDEEVCQGCFRTSQEITDWFDMSNAEKEKIIALLPC
jgi:predicted Fe-S protein YdhL (DUF1289 family)